MAPPPAPTRRAEKPQGLPPWRRLRRSSDFTRTERQGQRAQGQFLVVIARPASRNGRGRVGFTVSKKVGGAVVRNAVKRRLRDIARRHKDLWARRDLVIVARPDAAGRDLATLEADWLAALHKLDGKREQSEHPQQRAPARPPRNEHGQQAQELRPDVDAPGAPGGTGPAKPDPQR